MLPSTLKYSRCPSKDAKTLRKPPIIFYGGLGSRLRIITIIFTRLGTKTTDRAEVPGLPFSPSGPTISWKTPAHQKGDS